MTPKLHPAGAEALVLLHGETRAELLEVAAATRVRLRDEPELPLVELVTAAPEAQRRPPLAVVTSSAGDLDAKLAHAIERLADPACTRLKERAGLYYFEQPLADEGGLAFLFPGEGAQYPGMLADVCLAFPAARRWFDVADRACVRRGREPRIGDLLFGGDAGGEELWSMDLGAAAVFAANQALLAVMGQLSVAPEAVAGHSTGDYSALWASGALAAVDDDSVVDASCALSDLHEQVRGAGALREMTLIAVAAPDPAAVTKLLQAGAGSVTVALDNCPNQIVLAAAPEERDRVVTELAASGAVCTPLPFGRAYHTPAFAPFAEALRPFVAALELREPRLQLWSCATAAPYPTDVEAMRPLLVDQWVRPVRFRETVEAMHAAGIRIFVEVGPRGNLTSFVTDTLRSRPHLAVPANVQSRTGISQLLHLAGLLAAHGVPVDPAPLAASLPARAAAPAPRLRVGLPMLGLPAPRGPRVTEPAAQPVPAALPTDARTEVLEEYFRTMERFLASQGAVMGAFLERRGEPAGAVSVLARPVVSPLLGQVLEHEPERLIETERRLSIESDAFLRDHTLGRDVSRRDPRLLGLAVVPLTVSVELLAQAGAAVAPGLLPVAVSSVRAHRWIALDRGETTLRIHAERTGSTAANAWIEVDHSTVVEGVVELASAYPRPPAPRLEVRGGPSRWTREGLYAEGMFHGPAFRGVEAVTAWAEDGVAGLLVALPTDAVGADVVAEPMLLDAAGQLIGFWSAEHEALDVFPFAVERVELYGPTLSAGARATCAARIEHRESGLLRSELEIAAAGRVHARLVGWDDRRFALPEPLFRLRVSPADAHLGSEWPPGCRFVDVLTDELLDGGGGIWRSVVVHLLLDRHERAVWQALAPPRRDGWLRGRAAAKDAVRALRGDRVPPADVPIAADDDGRPFLPDDPLTRISISHCGEVAVALVAPGTAGAGVDIEPARPVAPDAARAAFDDSERALLGEARLVHGWCAKESAAKALGLGRPPTALRIVRDDAAEARLWVTERDGTGRELCARLWERPGLVAATCIIEKGV